MKKIFLSLAAVLSFSIASAQIDPAQPQQTKPDPVQGQPDGSDKIDTPVEIDTDVKTRENTKSEDVQTRKDEIKTTDHVKSTPDPEVARDKDKVPPKKTKRSKKQQ